MSIPGFNEIQAHLPDYSPRQAKLLVARFPATMIATLVASFFLDYLARLLHAAAPSPLLVSIEPWIPVVLPACLVSTGMLAVHTAFRKKARLVKAFPERAYQKVAKTILTGIPVVIAGVAYNLLPHGWLPLHVVDLPAANPATTLLSTSLFAHLSGVTWDLFPRAILGGFFLLLAIGIAARAVKVFGIDSASLLYVYFPEEAKMVKSNIYSAIRHPMYASAVFMSLAGMVMRCSIYSIIHFVIIAIAFSYHILAVEEKELVERFGDSYKKYKTEVPAVIARPRNWGKLFRFILGKES